MLQLKIVMSEVHWLNKGAVSLATSRQLNKGVCFNLETSLNKWRQVSKVWILDIQCSEMLTWEADPEPEGRMRSPIYEELLPSLAVLRNMQGTASKLITQHCTSLWTRSLQNTLFANNKHASALWSSVRSPRKIEHINDLRESARVLYVTQGCVHAYAQPVRQPVVVVVQLLPDLA